MNDIDLSYFSERAVETIIYLIREANGDADAERLISLLYDHRKKSVTEKDHQIFYKLQWRSMLAKRTKMERISISG